MGIFSFISGCFSKKEKTVNQTIDINNFDIKLEYKRQERSKDSNGSSELYILKGKALYFLNKYWGFKSEGRPTENISFEISENDSVEIYNFINENNLRKNYQKEIKSAKKHAFNTFYYTFFIKINENEYKIEISTKNHNEENKIYKSLEKLHYKLKQITNMYKKQ